MEPFFLAKLIGVYLLLYGAIAIIRKKAIMPAVSEMGKNKGLLLLFASAELAAGLAIVLSYPVVSLEWSGVVALIGWMLLVEGVLYLAFPIKIMQTALKKFNRPEWYLMGGTLSMALGAYLTLAGFGVL